MPTARAALAAATGPDGRIYAIGGATASNEPLTNVEAYVPVSHAWVVAAPLPTARRGAAAATGSDGRIYVMGGVTSGGTMLRSVEAYNVKSNTWTTVAPMLSPRTDFAAVAGLGGRIYVFGGINQTSFRIGIVESYDPTTDSWTALADMPTPRAELAAATGADGRIYVVGGTSQNVGTSNVAEVFVPPSDRMAPHDSRYFSQTGYRVDNDTIWDYFNRRGGVPTFGYPSSRTFTFQGFTVQFFQRRIVQLDAQGRARQLNLLDAGLLPYTAFNGSTFPGTDSGITGQAPSPTDQPATLAFVKAHAPDTFSGAPVNFYQTFINTVTPQVAFPNGGDPSLVPGINLEMWGIPTGGPLVDPNNHNFIYLRWQRGIMMYDGTRQVTEPVLLADYLKAILTGRDLPTDVDQESQTSPFYKQYDPTQPKWVHNPSLLPNTDLTNAFTQE